MQNHNTKMLCVLASRRYICTLIYEAAELRLHFNECASILKLYERI